MLLLGFGTIFKATWYPKTRIEIFITAIIQKFKMKQILNIRHFCILKTMSCIKPQKQNSWKMHVRTTPSVRLIFNLRYAFC